MLHRAPLLATSLLAFVSIAHLGIAQVPAPAVPSAKPTIEEIKVDMVPNPNRGSTQDRVLQDNWVVISVKFGTSDPWVDTLTMKVYIDGLEEPGKQGGYTVLDSQVVFVNVTPSREHYAKFYISPTAALRFGGPGGRAFKQSDVFVSLASGSDEPVTKSMKNDVKPWYQQGRSVPDMLVAFYDSPWWPLDSGMYQQFKKR